MTDKKNQGTYLDKESLQDLQAVTDAFANDGLEIPESLSEDAIREMIAKEPKPQLDRNSAKAGGNGSANAGNTTGGAGTTSRKRWLRPLIGVAACAVLVIALIPAMQMVLPNFMGGEVKPVEMNADATGLYQFSSYDELDQEMHSLLPEEKKDHSLSHLFGQREDLAEYEVYNEDMGAGDAETYDAAEGDAPAFATGEAKAESNATDVQNGAATGSTGSSGQHSDTYTQVEGIDEADIVKTDGKYIYYLSNIENQIIIAKASNGKAERVGAVGGATDGSYIDDIYINGDQLIVIGSDETSQNVRGKDTWTQTTAAAIYDISDRSHPKQLSRYTQTGYLVSSRLIGNSLCLVTNDQIHRYTKGKCLPFVSFDEGTPEKLPIGSISCFPQVSSTEYTVVGMIDLKTGKASKDTVKTKAVLGGSDEIYCSGANLYIASQMNGNGFDTIMRNDGDMIVEDAEDVGASRSTDAIDGSTDTLDDAGSTYTDDWNDPWQTRTQILKVALNGGKVKYKASAIVPGRVNNQWSMDERDGFFRVATTSEHDGEDVNNLFIFDKKMKQTGACIGFARDEHIEAVRYIKDKAYVITYQQTDPLFIIDLADPKNPVIEGHVKISGFSTLLVPADNDHLLGVGFGTETTEWGEATDGVKLALFDISDPSNPKVVDSKAFPDMYSQVQYDHKALLVGPATGSDGSGADYYAIPFEITHYDDDLPEVDWEEGVIDEDAEDDSDTELPPLTADSTVDADDGTDESGASNDAAGKRNDGDKITLDSGTGILVFSAKAGELQVLKDLRTKESVNRCIYIDDYIYGICSDDSIEGFKVAL